MEARVRRLGLYGRYKSSSSLIVEAPRNSFSSSGVSFSCSVTDASMASRRFSSSIIFSYRSRMAAIWTSSRLPVISLRYLAIKGTVAPSWSKFIVLSTWKSRTPSSLAICSTYFFSIVRIGILWKHRQIGCVFLRSYFWFSWSITK